MSNHHTDMTEINARLRAAWDKWGHPTTDPQHVYAEPCPHCGNNTQPVDITRVRDGYDCHYHCPTCSNTWEAAFWANPRHDPEAL